MYSFHNLEVTNRFKGIDLIYRVPEELWMEVHNIVQEEVIKTIPKKKKYKKAKYTKLNAEFQKVTRRDKKAFFSEQCKAIEETNQ